MYDPDVTYTGHQPLGLDQWMGLYDKYYVHASKIHVKAVCTSSTAVIAVLPIETTGTVTPITSLLEKPRSKTFMIQNTGSSSAGARSTYNSTIKFFGMNKWNAFDDELVGTSASDPSRLWYWLVAIQHPLS